MADYWANPTDDRDDTGGRDVIFEPFPSGRMVGRDQSAESRGATVIDLTESRPSIIIGDDGIAPGSADPGFSFDSDSFGADSFGTDAAGAGTFDSGLAAADAWPDEEASIGDARRRVLPENLERREEPRPYVEAPEIDIDLDHLDERLRAARIRATSADVDAHSSADGGLADSARTDMGVDRATRSEPMVVMADALDRGDRGRGDLLSARRPAIPTTRGTDPSFAGSKGLKPYRTSLPLWLRVFVPALVVAVGAAGAFWWYRGQANSKPAATELAALQRVGRDNQAAEGTLLRAQRDTEQAIQPLAVKAGIKLDTRTIDQSTSYMTAREAEVTSYVDGSRILTSNIDIRTQLRAMYEKDRSFVGDSVDALTTADTDPEGAVQRTQTNLTTLKSLIAEHRQIGVKIDDRVDELNAQLTSSPESALGIREYLAAALWFILLLIAIVWASRGVSRPVRRITESIRSLSRGNTDARSLVSGRNPIGKLGAQFDEAAGSVDMAIGRLEDDARRGSQNRVVFEALDIADSEAEVHRVVEQAMSLFAPEVPAELLLQEQGGARLWRIASNPIAGAPGCPVDSAVACFAQRRGQTVIFDSAESINSCPKLRNRVTGPCSAACVPVTFAGQSLGVLHATGPEGVPPSKATVDQFVDLASQVGARIGTLRTLESTRLQASTDGLTGLPNRRIIESGVSELLSRSTPFVMILADLDRFKGINDRFGHEVGDRSLQIFGRTLQDNVRDADLVARYGGEEFVIVYPEMTVGGSMEAIERIRLALEQALEASNVPNFTCSFGVTHSTVGTTFDEIFRVADAGLLVAKELGRNRAVYADQALATRVFGEDGIRSQNRAQTVLPDDAPSPYVGTPRHEPADDAGAEPAVEAQPVSIGHQHGPGQSGLRLPELPIDPPADSIRPGAPLRRRHLG